MLSLISLAGFVAAALVVLLVPGPGVIYVITRSISQGHRAGLVSVLGLSAGALVHVGAAVAGLSALLLASATAFGLVKLLGAGYLIFLGLRTLLVKESAGTPASSAHRPLGRLFRDGVLISALNPKIAVFFLAFLPQFADPARGSVSTQILLLGLIYVGLALITDGAYALLAGHLRTGLGSRILQGSALRYLSGGIYLGLGVSTALTGRPD